MPRIMALDVGESTLGIALSDPLGLTAQPLTTIRRVGPRKDLKALSELINRHEVDKIVVGLPLRLQGDAGPAAMETMSFVQRLEKSLVVPIVTWDERLTTVQAERALLEADVSRRRRKQIIDSVAAALILQSYLDSGGRTG